MENKTLFIYGAGGHAKVVYDIAKLQGYEVGGFIDDTKGGKYLDLPIIESSAFLEQKSHEECVVFIGIGNNAVRKEKTELMKERGFSVATLVHPNSVVAEGVEINGGAVLMAGAIVNPGARIGEGCIVNTNTSVDHDCSIGGYAHLAPGVTLGGGVAVGELSWVGIGASIREYKTVGKNVMIGMGAVVVEDIPDDVTAFGVPAKVQRKN